MDGRGPAHGRASDPGGAAAGHDRAAGADDGRARPAAEGRPRAGLVDPDHAPGLVAPGPRRLRLAPAAGRVPALHHRVDLVDGGYDAAIRINPKPEGDLVGRCFARDELLL